MATISGLTDLQIENALQRIRSMANGLQERSNADNGWDLAEGSDLALDDERISPHQTSHLAQQGILAAIDNLQALMLLTVEHRTLHAYAPATLARAAMECASLAIWVLEPDDRSERILRTLRSSTRDLIDADRAYMTAGIVRDPDHRQRLARVASIAGDVGVDERAAVKAVISTEVVTAADVFLRSAGGTGVLPMWQLTSGYAHGRQWASMAFGKREMRDTDDPDVVRLTFTFDYERLLAITAPACEAIVGAIDLYDWRARSPRHAT